MSSLTPEQWREYVDKHWGLPVPEGLRHGRNTKACRVYGCSCKVCLPSGRRNARKGEVAKSHSERQREMRERLRGTPVPPTVKHGPYAYRTYACRCDVCMEAKRAKGRRDRQGPPGRAVRSPHPTEMGITVVHWPPAPLTEPWACPHCDFKAFPA